jgi:hypothetical protein
MSSFVAMCLTMWASISPSSLRVIFFAAMRGSISRRSTVDECGDGLGVTQHENWKGSAQKLEVRRMRIGWDVHHGFWKGSAVLLALLSGRGGFGCRGVVVGGRAGGWVVACWSEKPDS